MPLSLTYTQGTLAEETISVLAKEITNAFLEWHNLGGNPVMTPNVTMQIQALPVAGSFSGGDPVAAAWLECKVPSFALTDRSVQEGFFSDASDLIERAANGSIARDKIFSNTVHTVDGTWNLGGKPLTNQQLTDAISAA